MIRTIREMADQAVQLKISGRCNCAQAVSAVLVTRFARSRQSGVHSDRSVASVEIVPLRDNGPRGYYLLSAYSWDEGGGEQAREQWYLLFNGDGSGSARLFEHDVIRFSYSPSRIVFEDGSSMPYTSEGDIWIDTAAVIVNARTYAPARALAEYFGYEVAWSGTMRTVMIN